MAACLSPHVAPATRTSTASLSATYEWSGKEDGCRSSQPAANYSHPLRTHQLQTSGQPHISHVFNRVRSPRPPTRASCIVCPSLRQRGEGHCEWQSPARCTVRGVPRDLCQRHTFESRADLVIRCACLPTNPFATCVDSGCADAHS